MSNARLRKLVDYFTFLFDTLYPEDEYNAAKTSRVVAVMVQTMTVAEAEEFIFHLLGKKGKQLKINRDPMHRKVECERFMRLVHENFPALCTDEKVYQYFAKKQYDLSAEDLKRIEEIEIESDDITKISFADAIKKYNLNRNTFKTKIKELGITVFENGKRKSIYEKDVKKIIEAIAW